MSHETNLIDVAWTKPTPAAVKAAGYAGVIGYISHDSSKDLGAKQAKAYLKAGLVVGLVFETTADEAEHHATIGAADRKYAEQRARAMGYPIDCVIFYAVDEDVAPARVADYFAGVHSGRTYPAGVYGDRDICVWLRQHHKADAEWQTVAWSNNETDDDAAIYQRNFKKRSKIRGVATTSYDEDVVMKPVKLWGGVVAPPGDHHKPAPPNPGVHHKPKKKEKKGKVPRRTPKPRRQRRSPRQWLRWAWRTKAKAIKGAIATGVASYIEETWRGGHTLTMAGLEHAIAVSIVGLLVVHKVKNKSDTEVAGGS